MNGKRHAGLLPLTHDHHHALAQARRLRVAAGGDASGLTEQAEEFLRFFDEHTVTHFREEEEILFPLVVGESEAEPVLARVMLDHLRIHALVGALRSEVDAEAAVAVAGALENHIRLEEKTVFPMIERLVAADSLSGLPLSPRNRD